MLQPLHLNSCIQVNKRHHEDLIQTTLIKNQKTVNKQNHLNESRTNQTQSIDKKKVQHQEELVSINGQSIKIIKDSTICMNQLPIKSKAPEISDENSELAQCILQGQHKGSHYLNHNHQSLTQNQLKLSDYTNTNVLNVKLKKKQQRALKKIDQEGIKNIENNESCSQIQLNTEQSQKMDETLNFESSTIQMENKSGRSLSNFRTSKNHFSYKVKKGNQSISIVKRSSQCELGKNTNFIEQSTCINEDCEILKSERVLSEVCQMVHNPLSEGREYFVPLPGLNNDAEIPQSINTNLILQNQAPMQANYNLSGNNNNLFNKNNFINNQNILGSSTNFGIMRVNNNTINNPNLCNSRSDIRKSKVSIKNDSCEKNGLSNIFSQKDLNCGNSRDNLAPIPYSVFEIKLCTKPENENAAKIHKDYRVKTSSHSTRPPLRSSNHDGILKSKQTAENLELNIANQLGYGVEKDKFRGQSVPIRRFKSNNLRVIKEKKVDPPPSRGNNIATNTSLLYTGNFKSGSVSYGSTECLVSNEINSLANFQQRVFSVQEIKIQDLQGQKGQQSKSEVKNHYDLEHQNDEKSEVEQLTDDQMVSQAPSTIEFNGIGLFNKKQFEQAKNQNQRNQSSNHFEKICNSTFNPPGNQTMTPISFVNPEMKSSTQLIRNLVMDREKLRNFMNSHMNQSNNSLWKQYIRNLQLKSNSLSNPDALGEVFNHLGINKARLGEFLKSNQEISDMSSTSNQFPNSSIRPSHVPVNNGNEQTDKDLQLSPREEYLNLSKDHNTLDLKEKPKTAKQNQQIRNLYSTISKRIRDSHSSSTKGHLEIHNTVFIMRNKDSIDIPHLSSQRTTQSLQNFSQKSSQLSRGNFCSSSQVSNSQNDIFSENNFNNDCVGMNFNNRMLDDGIEQRSETQSPDNKFDRMRHYYDEKYGSKLKATDKPSTANADLFRQTCSSIPNLCASSGNGSISSRLNINEPTRLNNQLPIKQQVKMGQMNQLEEINRKETLPVQETNFNQAEIQPWTDEVQIFGGNFLHQI